MKLPSRRPVTGAFAALTALALLAPAATAADLAPDDGVYRAEIRRTSYGIPHILAEDYGSLGFGQGYGAAEDIICSLADTLVTARAERSKWFGPEARYHDQVTLNATNLAVDTVFGDIIQRGVVEDLLASEEPGVAPGPEVRAIVEGYVAGVNQYLADVGGADGIEDPACAGAPWVRPAEPIDLYRGIYAANLLASAGVFVQEIADAEPPSVSGESGLPLGLLGLDEPGLPAGSATASQPRFAPVPDALPSSDELRAGLGKDPERTFGSNGTALGGDVTDTGRGMVLGNPHFPWQGRYRFSQSHLRIPGEYDVAGAMLHGSPVVNIGFNDQVAWTHTVSTAYRFTPYEYRLLPGADTTYLTTEGPKEVQRREVEVELPDGSTTTEDVWATDEGFVIDAPDLLMGWTPLSVFAIRDANAEHLRTLDVFHEMAKSTDVGELLANQDRAAGMPWVNTIAADRDGDAMYADHSVVPHVTEEQIEACMTPIGRVLFELAGLPGLDGTRATADCAWGSDEDASRAGTLGPSNLPDVTTRDWVINANDSHWLPNPDIRLEGFSPIIGCEECERSLRTRMVYRYVLDRLDGSDGFGGPNVFTHEQLERVETTNRVFGAEVAREGGDLDTACRASGVDTAFCDVLADWDGTTDVDAVGAHLFRELWNRTPQASLLSPTTQDRFEVPFDPADPVNTPRDLDEDNADVLAAFESAAARIADLGVPLDAPLGDLQKAGDEGAGDIPVHGGFGSTGNANVIAISDPTANTDVPYPVSYGSSHIQAVAFTDEGVDASTILTYGQSYDPTSDHHDDQTALWAGEEWVDVPFTEEEIAADLVSTKVVTNAPAQDAVDDRAPSDDVAAPAPAGAPLPATGGPGWLVASAGLLLAGGAALRPRRTGRRGVS